jgi:dihydroxyacetone kinase-like protein
LWFFKKEEGKVKKFVNDPAHFVSEMMEGLALANPDALKWIPKYNIIYRSDMPREKKVSIIQGSGSGHEPAHIMLVGKGMLDAACPGNVFAAPPMEYCYECIKLMNSPQGVLCLVNNYQGDRMVWDMAREMAEAEGYKTGLVIIDDDVAVEKSTHSVGRRGVAGNFFVIKACAAAAEEGASLEELVTLGNKVNSVVRTMGVALTSCTPPAKGAPIFEIGEDEMEMGVGIHGEPGRRRAKIKPADAILDEVFQAVVTDLPFQKGDRVDLMINGLGGTPISELYLLYRKAALNCKEQGLDIVRSYVGNYCTSLEMAGFSLTLIRLDNELERLLTVPAEIPIRVF